MIARLLIALIASLLVGGTAVALAAPSHQSLGVVSSYPSVILADSPAGYWPLDDPYGTVAGDRTGAHPGTYLGGVTLQQPLIHPNGAASARFDGATGWISVPYAPALNTTTHTIEIWCVQTGNAERQGLITSLKGTGWGYSWDLHGYSPSPSSNGRIRLLMGQVGLQPFKVFQFNYNISQNTPTYFAITYDGTTLRQYVNGVLNASYVTPYQPLTPATANDFRIGVGGGGNWYWDGYLSDVAAYDYALSETQIAAHFAAR